MYNMCVLSSNLYYKLIPNTEEARGERDSPIFWIIGFLYFLLLHNVGRKYKLDHLMNIIYMSEDLEK